MISVLGREVTGNNGGGCTEGLIGKLDGKKGCVDVHKLEGIERWQKVYGGTPKGGS